MVATKNAPGAPPRQARKLTELAIERLRPPASGRAEVRDGVISGLSFRTTDRGAKTWAYSYRPKGGGPNRRVTPGRWPAIAVKDARDIARGLAARVARGEDPALDHKREAAGDGDRFEIVAQAFIERVVGPRQLRTGHQTATLIENRLVRAWRGRRIGEIRRGDVIRVLDAEIDHGRQRTANKLLAVTRRLFDWAAERHDLDRNPAAGISRPGVERSRDRVLDDAELTAVWTASEVLGWPWGLFIRLLVLTGQRRREVSGLLWAELDLDGATWRLPAERSKSARAYVIPLSEPVLEILRAAPRLAGYDHVFWTGRGAGLSGFGQSKAKLDRIIARSGAEIPRWALHDLRRSAATGMAQLGVEPHVLAAVLNHAPASVQGVTAIYNRSRYEPEKRRALELWAEHVLALAEGRAPKVVALARPA